MLFWKNGKLAVKEIPDGILLTDRRMSDGAGNLKLTTALAFMGVKPGDEFDQTGWQGIRKKIQQLKDGPMSRTSAMAVRPGGIGNVTASHRIWEGSRGVGEVPSPLIYRGHLYMIKNGGVLTVLSVDTGKQV